MQTPDLIWQQLADVARSFPLLAIKRKGMVRPYTDQQIEAAMRGFLEASQPKTMRMLYDTWDRQRSLITQRDLIEGATNGTITTSTLGQWQAQYVDYVNNRLAPIWRAGGSTSANFIAESLGLNFPNYQPRFPQALERIDAWIKQSGGELIKQLTDEQKAAVNSILRHHIVNEPLSADELGKVLRPVVGLTQREANAVKNRRSKLIEGGLTAAQATREVAKYAAKLHRVRAERIARTELVSAFSQGALAGINASIAEGTLTPLTVKEWNTAEDERTCPICKRLHGTTKALDEPFKSGRFSAEVSPIHPSCRCTIIYVVDEDAQLGLTPPAAEESESLRLTDAERRKFVEDTYSDPSLDADIKPDGEPFNEDEMASAMKIIGSGRGGTPTSKPSDRAKHIAAQRTARKNLARLQSEYGIPSNDILRKRQGANSIIKRRALGGAAAMHLQATGDIFVTAAGSKYGVPFLEGKRRDAVGLRKALDRQFISLLIHETNHGAGPDVRLQIGGKTGSAFDEMVTEWSARYMTKDRFNLESKLWNSKELLRQGTKGVDEFDGISTGYFGFISKTRSAVVRGMRKAGNPVSNDEASDMLGRASVLFKRRKRGSVSGDDSVDAYISDLGLSGTEADKVRAELRRVLSFGETSKTNLSDVVEDDGEG